jgi:transposase-like protein
MGQAIDEHLDRVAELDQADRRNGSYRRHLLIERGEIELLVPRTPPLRADRGAARVCPAGRTARPHKILACFVLRLSTRKVGEALLPILGRPISPATVSTLPDRLDCRIDVEPRAMRRP